MQLHNLYSKQVSNITTIGGSVDTGYSSWFEENLLIIAAYLRDNTKTRRILCQKWEQINTFEITQIGAGGDDTSPVTSTSDIVLTFDNPVVASTSVQSATKPMKSIFVRKLGYTQLEYAKVLFHLLIQRKGHLSPTNFGDINSRHSNFISAGCIEEPIVNVIDAYLDETKDPEPYNANDLNNFQTDLLTDILSLSADTINHLRATKYESQSKLLLYCAKLAYFLNRKEFDTNWVTPIPSTLLSTATPIAIAKLVYSPKPPSAEAIYYRDQLILLTKELINSSDKEVIALVSIACLLLIESFGSNESYKASYWLF
jgi:hypothetical protein